ncbi:MAG: phosphatase PAP2 family protein [Anaerolineae bacterium]|nr:phosphatase PAP2 family protein [Anaerolineae bacterium]
MAAKAAALALVLLLCTIVLASLESSDRVGPGVLRGLGSSWVTGLMLLITRLGSTVVVATLALGWAWIKRRSGTMVAAVPGLAAAGGGLLSLVVKEMVHRPRPEVVEALVKVDSFSFPSGHALLAMAFYGAVALLLAPSVRTRCGRMAIYGLTGAVLLLIGVSRLHLGVHYLSDVVGGYALGAAWLSALWLALPGGRGSRDGEEPVSCSGTGGLP